MFPLITVLIPAYNYGRFITEAIDSVLTQAYPNVEVVVTDNASTDDTVAIVRARYADEPRVRLYVHERNVGMNDNYNLAVQWARGEFIAWLAADDWLLPGHLANLHALFVQEPRLDVVYSRSYNVDTVGRAYAVKGDKSLFPVSYIDARDELPGMLSAVNQVCLPAALFRRELFGDVGPFDGSIMAGDWEYSTRLALEGKRFGYVAEPSMCYRVHGSNISGDSWMNSGGGLDDIVSILEKFMDHPGMTRLRGYELRVVKFMEWFAARTVGFVDESHAALRGRFEKVRDELVRRHEIYEPARVREQRVSVAIPMTMRPATFMRAVESVVAQTFSNWEILVVDQGTIPVRELLRAHPAWDRISCVRLPRQRLAGAARNLAAQMARGEYLTFLDEDNIIGPDHLETLVATIERTGCDVAVASARLVVDRAGGEYGLDYVPLATVEGLFRGPSDPPSLGAVANALPLNAILHHRRFYERAGHFNDDVVVLEDFDYLMRLQATSAWAFTGATTLNVHARLNFEAQVLGTYARHYLTTLDALYASRAVEPEVQVLRDAHRAAVADVLARRAELSATAPGMVELITALAGRAVVSREAPAPVG